MKPNPYKVLLADDEPVARQVLQSMLAAYPDVAVVAACADGATALQALEQTCPDIAFLDIRMPQPNGLQLTGQMPSGCFPVIVFVTAYDEFALQAFEVNAVDYLLKPFDQKRFDKAFQRAVEQVALRQHYSSGQLIQKYQALASLSPPTAPLEVLLVKDGGKTQLVRVAELTHLEADGNYVALHTPTSKYLLHETLSALEAVLDRRLFCRVHRSIIVRVSSIKEIRSHFNGDYTLILDTGKPVRLSRNFKQQLETLIGQF